MSERLAIRLRGGLLLGGAAAAGLHAATLRDREGFPFIPASALKGAVREQLVRLVGEARARQILGGNGPTGFEPERAGAVEERPGGGSTRVYLSDATLTDQAARELFSRGSALGYDTRTQVAIDRRSRRSAHQLLFQREILAPAPGGIRLQAEVDLSLLDPEERREFTAAVGAVFALGAGRTGGLGGVEMALVQAPGLERREEAAIPESDAVELELEALDPLCLGPDVLLGNFQETLDHIPASALRGAVVTAALQARGLAGRDQSDEPWFRELVLDPATCLRFSDAWPIEDCPSRDDRRPRLAPLTLQTCKAEGFAHGVADWLLGQYFRTLLAERGVFIAVEEKCPVCAATNRQGRGRLVPARRPLWSPEPERRIVTRLGLDRRLARGAEGQLFSLELLERGTRFCATVAGLGREGRRLLADAMRRPLRVGHGRGQGYGRMKITSVLPAAPADLAARLERFDSRVRRGLEEIAAALGIDSSDLGGGRHHFAATLWSDLVPGESDSSAEAALLAALDLDGAEMVYGQVRADQRGGWDARRRRPKPYHPVVRAGSVLLLATEEPLDSLLPRLAELERRGAGASREEGFGWVCFSDPIHAPEWRKP
jgi:CRISPR-associated protein Csx10